MELTTLQTLWFILTAVLFTGYAVLDGFDLGVGVLHLFTKDEQERRINLNSVGPVWDGNEVWLIAGGGALFAAFAPVYAAIWSGFYLALILLLLALIGRAVAFDFRAKSESASTRAWLDRTFGVGSLLIALLLGVAFGNILRGIPIDADGWYAGTFFTLLNPYAVFVGLFTVVLCVMHGALYLALKSEGPQHERMVRVSQTTWMASAAMYVLLGILTFFMAPHLFEFAYPEVQKPLWYVFILISLVSIAAIPVLVGKKQFTGAFVSSALLLSSMIWLGSVGLFPTLVPSTLDASYNLTAFAHSSTQYTLTIMLYIALSGMPFAILYRVILYRVFHGKTVLTKDSY